jgi:hypothetical protein
MALSNQTGKPQVTKASQKQPVKKALQPTAKKK